MNRYSGFDIKRDRPAPSTFLRAMRRGAVLGLMLAWMAVATARGQCISQGSGIWNLAATWSCNGSPGIPGSGDAVTIASGHTVILNASTTVAALTVVGTLNFDSIEDRSFRVLGDVTINAGGTFAVQSSGTATTHLATFDGDLTNNGTLNFNDTQVANVVFAVAGNKTITGTGTTTFNNVTLNLDAASVLDVQAVITMASGGLTLTNGTFKLSSGSTITPFSGSVVIPATAGFHLNDENAVSNWGSGGSLTVNGALTITDGAMTVGTGTTNKLDINGSSAVFMMDGGTLNLPGRYKQTSSSTASISGGTIHVATAGEAGTSSEATFQVPSGSALTMTAGVVRIHNANGSTGGGLAITTGQSNIDITGGTFIIGNGASTSGTIEIELSDSIFNLEIDAGSTTPTIVAGSTLDIDGNFTVNSGQLILEDNTAMLTTTDPSGIGVAATDQDIDGDAGWRMLSVPRTGMTVSDLADQNLVQGLNDKFPDADENLYTSYTGAWNEPGGLNTSLVPGEGFIWYFFDNDQGESNALPFTLSASAGTGDASDPVIGLNSSGWTLVGNPFGHDIDFNKLVGVGKAAPLVGQVWDNTAGTYTATSAHNDEVAYWQGAFVENTTGATGVVMPNAAKTGTDASFLKASQATTGQRRMLQLTLSGDDPDSGSRTYDEACILYFTSGAVEGWDAWDASKLTPLSTPFATLAVVGERDGQIQLKAQDSRPFDLDLPLELQLSVTTLDMAGDFSIAWPTLETLPGDWQFVLIDHVANREIDLREVPAYPFTLTADKAPADRSAARAFAALDAARGRPVTLAAGGEPRFTLRLTPGVVNTSVSDEAEVPARFRLEPNYPNPFNPLTTIRYAVPKDGPVRVVVYDALGRQMAVLVDGWQPAGRHTVTWDAASHASGVYLYRLETGEQALTRTMLLLK